MTRVIHTGDTHLGYRQYHSPERRRDFLEAFRRVIEDAVADGVDAVVHAGDLFHDRSPALADIHGAIEVLRRLREADIPFLAVVGNHERTRGGQWLDLFETLGLAVRLGREPTTVGDVDFYGLDYVPPSRRDDLAYDFAPGEAEHAALVTHGAFDPFVPAVRSDRWDLSAVLAASPVAFDAALLGDDHTPDTRQVDGTWASYPGSTERVDASERDERGYNIVAFDEEVSISRRGLDTREFVFLDLDLAPGEGLDRVRERLREEDLEGAVVLISIEGDGEEVPAARVEEFAAERGALIARVTDRREVDAADDVPAVRFADPDEAVRERVRELGLSEAAAAIDATVRDDRIADTNVRDRLAETVEELLEDDPDAFVPAEPAEGPGSDDGTGEAAGSAVGPSEDPAEDGSADPDGATVEAATDPAPSTGGDDGGSNGSGPTEASTDGDGDGDGDGEPSGERTTTMEDFL